MPERINPRTRSENMRRIRSSDTKPEMIVRRLTHAMGFRYRLHAKDLPGKPDLVFRPHRKVIFVHGCFWHQHDCNECDRTHNPKSNLSYWSVKLMKNVNRDKDNLQKLAILGWSTLVIWECKTNDEAYLKKVIADFLEAK